MTDITALKGIGEKSAGLYARIGIDTVESAIYYFPRDYITYEEISEPGGFMTDRVFAFEATVIKRPVSRKTRRTTVTTAKLAAGDVYVSATWFNMPYLSSSLKSGSSYIFRGKLSAQGDHYHIEQPGIYSKEQYDEMTGHINPVYTLTKGLSNNALTKTVKRSFEYLAGNYSPEVYDMHFPKDEQSLRQAREKLVYEEFLLFMLRLGLLGKKEAAKKNSFNIIEVAQCSRIIEKLPYKLTGAQERVWKEIKNDLCSETSMRRLVQGDVGSGKTILALLSAVMVAVNGYQSAIMAPTEILANQHYETITGLLKENGIDLKPVLLSGSMSNTAKANVREMIKKHEADIIIGTHALFQEKVEYPALALVVTDEQHRFGVNQRSMLPGKNTADNAHILVMSATPIPRTLAMILYGDLDISVIDEMPAERIPIKNAIVNESWRKKAYDFMKKEIDKGHQVYVICPLIEESEGLDLKNVSDTAAAMSEYFGDKVNIRVLHGRMKSAAKQAVMEEFEKGIADILVSTTVVEVGVNVKNATVMMIENADRFGLAALHQLRGRIGRSDIQSYCIFMSSKDDPEKNARLEILKRSNDGFEIAEEDLKQRGPGDMFGIRQSGQLDFVLADIYTDSALLKKAAKDAADILRNDPDLSRTENTKYRDMLNRYKGVSDIDETL